MKQQSYEHHKRFHPLQHFVLLPISVVTLVASIVYAVKAITAGEFSLEVFLILALVVMSLITGLLARINALTVQDRVIRAEEQFRYFVLTGKWIDSRLTIPQWIALRFASDREFPALADKAAQEGMSPKEIKRAIKHWRADEHRV
ncbi:DUF6526 family protein [Paenibacillus sp. J2TS4]|uniref:DUF6526 family protein n=1 Tax=Paenibacillus sp. J2TS4 TaxID=2807194 RepID=UPI001B0BBAFB|nr:DUF6526 family protein [Paenibacillus sp. J2TS4]GIP36039.1 hypothetical protein J2TS4_52490 [Paenibacillus sp. J2TS4]